MKALSLLAAIGFLLVPTAHAVPIQYDWTGVNGGTGWSATGTIVIDDSDFGRTLDANVDFQSWMFSWTDGVSVVSIDDTTGTFAVSENRFATDASGSIGDYSLCAQSISVITFGCSGLNLPLISFGGITTNRSGSRWNATLPQGGNIGHTYSTGSFSAPTAQVLPPTSQVPLPGSLALIGAGIVAFGVRRKFSHVKG